MPRSLADAGRLRWFCFMGGVVCAVLLVVSLAGCRLYKADPHVAFFGDSLIEDWTYPSVNLGKFGSTTGDLLARSHVAIEGHKFTKVVILGGANDVLLSIDPKISAKNIEAIATSVQQAGEEPVLCEIPPVFHDYIETDTRDFSEPVRILNEQIAELAAQHHWKLADLYHPMLGHPDYSVDGVHMKRRGYLVMELALLRAVPDA